MAVSAGVRFLQEKKSKHQFKIIYTTHLIIFDEFDSICKSRGSTGDNTGVQDNVVNQLLSKIEVSVMGSANAADTPPTEEKSAETKDEAGE